MAEPAGRYLSDAAPIQIGSPRWNEAMANARLIAAAPDLLEAAEMLWVVLANVSGGDWTKQSKEWQDAAASYRDLYFAANRKATEPTP